MAQRVLVADDRADDDLPELFDELPARLRALLRRAWWVGEEPGYLRRKLAGAAAPNLPHTVRGVGSAVRRP